MCFLKFTVACTKQPKNQQAMCFHVSQTPKMQKLYNICSTSVQWFLSKHPTLRAFLLVVFRSIPKTSILFNPSAYCRFARLRKIETAAGLRTICMRKNAKWGFGTMKRSTASAQRHAKAEKHAKAASLRRKTGLLPACETLKQQDWGSEDALAYAHKSA